MRTYDVNERAAAITAENEVKIDGVVYRPVPITTTVRRTLKGTLNQIRRAARRATAASRTAERLQKEADERDEPLTDAEEQELDDKVAEQETLRENHEDHAERLTQELIAQQLADDDGNHPTADLIAERLPVQLQKSLFEWLNEVGDDTRGSGTGPTKKKPIGSTPA